MNLLRWKRGLVDQLLGVQAKTKTKMKASKLLAMLVLAGFCGTSEAQARSHKSEIQRLEKQRAEHVEAHREAKERLSELDSRINSRAAAVKAESRMRPAPFEAAEVEDESPDAWENEVVPVHGNWAAAEQEIRSFNWDVRNPDLIRERELEEARMREAAREIVKIDKAIRKEKARERCSI